MSPILSQPNDELGFPVAAACVKLEEKLQMLFADLADDERRQALQRALDILQAMLQSMPFKSQ